MIFVYVEIWEFQLQLKQGQQHYCCHGNGMTAVILGYFCDVRLKNSRDTLD